MIFLTRARTSLVACDMAVYGAGLDVYAGARLGCSSTTPDESGMVASVVDAAIGCC